MDKIEEGKRYLVTHSKRGRFEFEVHHVTPGGLVLGEMLTDPKGAMMCDIVDHAGSNVVVDTKKAIFKAL